MNYFILDENKNVVITQDVNEWSSFFSDSSQRRVALDEFGDIKVSTIFLGIDHSFSPEGPCLLFETMIFGGEHDQYQDRCSTWDEALRMHEEAINLVKPN